jgi:hypothetical protein
MATSFGGPTTTRRSDPSYDGKWRAWKAWPTTTMWYRFGKNLLTNSTAQEGGVRHEFNYQNFLRTEHRRRRGRGTSSRRALHCCMLRSIQLGVCAGLPGRDRRTAGCSCSGLGMNYMGRALKHRFLEGLYSGSRLGGTSCGQDQVGLGQLTRYAIGTAA